MLEEYILEIFKDELCIAEAILSNCIIACEADLESLVKADGADQASLTLATIYDRTPNTPDLYPVKSILVTTNRNKNGDVFLPAEVWRAKSTPVDKMINVMHSHHKVVGHICSTWAIDPTHNVLEESLGEDQLPSLFHVVNAGVLYAKWADEELQASMDTLISEVKEGKWKTSMEARFAAFDYGVYQGEELVKVVERNDTTAFLTKKLRCYGGDGTHDGYTLGRVLRNIIFSGNSLVLRPANPDSVIFAEKTEKNPVEIIKTLKSGVDIKCTDISEEKSMSENILEKQVEELKATLKDVQAKNVELVDKLASANTEKLTKEVESLKAELAESRKMMEDEEGMKKKSEESCATITQEFNTLQAEYKKLKSDMDAIRAEAIKATRVQKLVEAGLSKEDATAKTASLAGLSDEQFEVVASALSIVKPPVKSEEQKAEDASAELTQAEEEDGVDATVVTNEVQDLEAAFASHFADMFNLKENK